MYVLWLCEQYHACESWLAWAVSAGEHEEGAANYGVPVDIIISVLLFCNYYCIHLMAFFLDNLGKPSP